MRKGKKLAALVISLLLFFAALPCAAAAQRPKGSITIFLAWQGQPLTGGSVTLYRVSDLDDSIADLSPETAAALARYAVSHGIEGWEQPLDDSGTVRFGELEAGLYLLVQERACAGFLPFQPFLVGIPMQIDDTLFYDVDASPKAAPEPMPTEPGTPPPPGLPQTGQTNWPIPVLGGSGLMLVAIGLWITGRDRREG